MKSHETLRISIQYPEQIPEKKLSPTDQVWQCSRGYAILARLRGFTISARRRGFAIRAQQSLKSSNPNPQIGRYLIH